MHLLKKKTKGVGLQGIKVTRPQKFKKGQLPKRCKTVTRPYGGVLTATECRDRIMKAFLVEEFRAFKNMKTSESKKKSKKAKKTSKK